jgi:signal transduction histidine kinase/DNA-binding response OmpR family regulator/ligand-binding sensor domain-containing protein
MGHLVLAENRPDAPDTESSPSAGISPEFCFIFWRPLSCSSTLAMHPLRSWIGCRFFSRILTAFALASSLFLFFITPHALSQTLLFDRFTAKDGLPSNWITTVYQDSRGYIWAAGDGGMSRYDGVSFTTYGTVEGLPVPLVWTLIESRSSPGTMFIAPHLRGLNKFKDGSVTPIAFEEGTETQTLLTILEDRRGTLWFGTGPGVFRVENDTARYFPTGRDSGLVRILHETQAGSIVMAVDRAVYRYLPDAGELRRLTIGSESRTPTCILEDSDGMLWIGTFQGEILRIQGDSITASRQTPVKELNAVAQDRAGNLWFASVNGLINVRRTGFPGSAILQLTTENGLPENEIIACLIDREDNLWIGGRSTGLSKLAYRNILQFHLDNFNPNLLNRAAVVDPFGHIFAITETHLWEFWKSTVGTWHTFAHPVRHIVNGPTTGDQLIGGMSVDIAPDGQLWVGFTWGGLRSYRITHRNDLHSILTPVHTLRPGVHLPDGSAIGTAISADNQMLYNVREGLLTHIDLQTLQVRGRFKLGPGISGGTAQAILFGPGDTVWVASFNDGIYVLARDGDIYKFVRRLTTNDGLASDRVRSIIQRRNGDIWIGTRFEGISIYRNGQFRTLTSKHGLRNNAVWKLAEDEEGRVWVGTSVGMQYTDPDGETFHAHPRLSGQQIAGIVIASDRKTLLSISTGQVMVYEYGVEQRSQVPPLIEIAGLRVNGVDRALNNELVFSHDENFCVVRFNGVSFKDEGGLLHRFRLIGLDTTWSEPTSQRVVTFGSLRPGAYTFEARAMTADGTESERPATLSFVILPPWYLSAWTIGLYVLVASILVFSYVRIRTRRLEKRSIELERVVAERTAELIEHRNLLHDQAEKLRELDTMKSHFFTNISHEFRTPLAVILGHIEKLKHATPAGEVREYSIMERNARRLLQLINQLLDLSKLEAGGMTLRAARADIAAFTRRVTASFTSYADHKGIALTMNGSPVVESMGMPAIHIYFDRDKMEKILTNLLSNALKFTPHGGRVDVALSLRDATNGERNHEVEIVVKDSGVGIPAAKLPYVFDRFYQVEDYSQPGFEGTGVGLALVKELVELHHGSVHVSSEEAKWTAFAIRLPLGSAHLDEGEIVETPSTDEFASAPPLPDIDPEVAAESETGFSPDDTRILIVEDNTDLRAFIRDQLMGEYAVIEAADGTTGLRKAEEYVPDLIISDIMMPGMDGYALCRAVKSSDKTNHIPVILLTAKAATENKLEGLETGADDYLTKPFNAEELRLRAKNLIGTRRQLREKFSGEMLLRPSEITVPSAQKIFLEKVTGAIEQHLAEEEFSVESLAATLGMSRAQLHRKVKALTNKAPNELIRSFRLQRAAALIRQDAGSLAEIAYQVGFNSQAYFTRCFVDEFGKTPTEYKKTAETQRRGENQI